MELWLRTELWLGGLSALIVVGLLMRPTYEADRSPSPKSVMDQDSNRRHSLCCKGGVPAALPVVPTVPMGVPTGASTGASIPGQAERVSKCA